MLALLFVWGYIHCMAYGHGFESIADGNWHWCPSPYNKEPLAGVNDISVVVDPSEPGHRPASDHHRLFAQYITPEAGITFLGDDMYASQGRLRVSGREILAVMTPWPLPDFMNSDDGALFIRAWTTEELEVGHFHMPFLYILEEDTVSKLRS